MVANERKLDHWTGKLKRDLHLPCGFCPFEFQSIWYKLKWKIYMWFSILDSFDYSPPVASAFGRRSACLRPTPKHQHAKELLLALWVFRISPNMDRVIGSWLGLLNNHHMIKNTELEFEHRTDIACDKLDGLFAILGRDSDLILAQVVSMREKTLGNTNLIASCHTERKILTPTQILHTIRYCARVMSKNALC